MSITTCPLYTTPSAPHHLRKIAILITHCGLSPAKAADFMSNHYCPGMRGNEKIHEVFDPQLTEYKWAETVKYDHEIVREVRARDLDDWWVRQVVRRWKEVKI